MIDDYFAFFPKRFILNQFDALSWLTVDPVNRDRRSSLPVHLCMLAQLHEAVACFMDSQGNSASSQR